jgi:photosystem II stability/assembly factor-like uncharacterized protein
MPVSRAARLLLALAPLACLCTTGAAQQPEPDWQPMAAELLKAEKPGYGGLCGIVVDHASGTLYLNLSDKGMYRSTDQGKSFERMTTRALKGRTEWPGCLQIGPTGKSKTMLVALVYGAPISLSDDGGATWKPMSPKSSHVDWAAIDWNDRKFVLALKHESGDLLIASDDGGKNFRDVGKGYGPAWVFDHQTAVVAGAKTKDQPKPGLLRTTDGGKTFQPCGDYFTKALPRWRDGKLYWVVEGALIASTDKGASWQKLGALKDGRFGPVFGKDARHLFVLTGAGIVESKDGGATWGAPIPVPKAMKGINSLTWFDYDPTHDVLYVMKMASDLYRLQRKS